MTSEPSDQDKDENNKNIEMVVPRDSKDVFSFKLEEGNDTEDPKVAGDPNMSETLMSLGYTSGDEKDEKNPFSSVLTESSKIVIAWENLSYIVPSFPNPIKLLKRIPQKPKIILDKVSGFCKQGQLLAIIGSTGAGKSSLLNVLANRGNIKSRHLSGSITINGQETLVHGLRGFKGRKLIRKLSSYVQQDDIMTPTLTVKESLEFSVALRTNLGYGERKRRVKAVIDELGLTKAANTMVGNEAVRGISGGERKRTAIGIELVADLPVIFLDEPTTGLDSFTAQNIMRSLLRVARAGRTIIATIHQPRSNIYKMFDKVMILAQGQVMYFGQADTAVSYFTRLGFPTPELTNPADFLIDCASVDNRGEKSMKQSTERITRLAESWQKSPENKVQEEALITAKSESSAADLKKWKRAGFASWYHTQFIYLFSRSFRQFYRQWFFFIIRFFQSVMFAVLLGILFGVPKPLGRSQSSLLDRSGAIFFIIINQTFGPLFGATSQFLEQVTVFQRERGARMYRVSPFYLTKNAAELPGDIIFPVVFCAIVYFFVGFQTDALRFFSFLGIVVMTSLVSISIGLMLSAAVKNQLQANIFSPLFLIVAILFSGFYKNLGDIWAPLGWFSWLSFLRYSYTALMLNELVGLDLDCIQPVIPNVANGTIPFAGAFMNNTTEQPCIGYTTGDQALAQIWSMGPESSNPLTIGWCYLALALFIIVFRVIGYLLLRFCKKGI